MDFSCFCSHWFICMVNAIAVFKFKLYSIIGVYGSDAVKAFNETTKNSTICLGNKETVYDDATDEEIVKIVKNSTDFNPVVVCFCEGRTVRRFYQLADKLNITRKSVLFIFSDGWTEIDNITRNCKGNFQSIMINTSPQLKVNDTNFNKHYQNLTEWNKSINPWVNEFYEHSFNCSFNDSSKSSDNVTRRICYDNETLPENFFQDPKLPLVRYSIRMIANATNEYVKENCEKRPNLTKPCDPESIVKAAKDLGPFLMNYTQKNPIIYGNNERFEFNDKGDPKISTYEILFHANNMFQSMGNWSSDRPKNKTLQMNDSFKDIYNKYRRIPNKCNPKCLTGQFVEDNLCCWRCKECSPISVSNGSVKVCQNCSECDEPDKPRANCVPKQNNLVKFYDPKGSLCLFISSAGAALTSFTAYVFYENRRTPIVKFSSTHLSFIIFCGMGLAYSCTLLNLWEPTNVTCIILRFIPSISLTMIFAPILMKINRISRALSASKKKLFTLRLKYLSAPFLISASLAFVFANFILCTVQTLLDLRDGEIPEVNPFCELYNPIKQVFCPNESVAAFNIRHSVNVFLLVYCASYAYRSGLELPDNFNEARFVIVSCASTAIVWIAFSIGFIFLQDSTQWPLRILILSLALSLSALINLICMYFPKVYIILRRPIQNHRAFFSTATGMRCYFGNTESRCRAFSSVNMDSTAGDPAMITKSGNKNDKKTLKNIESKKTQKNEKRSKLPKCGANCLICINEGKNSLSN